MTKTAIGAPFEPENEDRPEDGQAPKYQYRHELEQAYYGQIQNYFDLQPYDPNQAYDPNQPYEDQGYYDQNQNYYDYSQQSYYDQEMYGQDMNPSQSGKEAKPVNEESDEPKPGS